MAGRSGLKMNLRFRKLTACSRNKVRNNADTKHEVCAQKLYLRIPSFNTEHVIRNSLIIS